MNKIENKEGVTEIVMHPVAYCKCAIGQDWYKCEFDAEFLPKEYYPDYMEVNDFVMREIDGKELNIEEAAKILYDHLMEYEPRYVCVTNHIKNCKTHFDVDVKIEGIDI